MAQAVLRGQTRGYLQHPQLLRFRDTENPIQAIAHYLRAVHDEAAQRSYQFDRSKIGRCGNGMKPIPVTQGRMRYEWKHLQTKLAHRDPEWLQSIEESGLHEPHPAVCIVAGNREMGADSSFIIGGTRLAGSGESVRAGAGQL